jgi:hypothetical protein
MNMCSRARTHTRARAHTHTRTHAHHTHTHTHTHRFIIDSYIQYVYYFVFMWLHSCRLKNYMYLYIYGHVQCHSPFSCFDKMKYATGKESLWNTDTAQSQSYSASTVTSNAHIRNTQNYVWQVFFKTYILINSHHMHPPLFVHKVDADLHPKKEDIQPVICIISLL